MSPKTTWIKLGAGGTNLAPLHPAMWTVIEAVAVAFPNNEVMITSTWEGIHIPWSCHYRKRALDFRKPHGYTREAITAALRPRLNKHYDITVKDCIHVEYDPKDRPF